jgi:hypothetical protein
MKCLLPRSRQQAFVQMSGDIFPEERNGAAPGEIGGDPVYVIRLFLHDAGKSVAHGRA